MIIQNTKLDLESHRYKLGKKKKRKYLFSEKKSYKLYERSVMVHTLVLIKSFHFFDCDGWSITQILKLQDLIFVLCCNDPFILHFE